MAVETGCRRDTSIRGHRVAETEIRAADSKDALAAVDSRITSRRDLAIFEFRLGNLIKHSE